MKSKIKSKKAIKFGQVLLVDRLRDIESKQDEYVEALKRNSPNITLKEIQDQLFELAKRDAFYCVVMDEVARAYEFELDESEIAEKQEALMYNEVDVPIEHLREKVSVLIKKRLIYEDLADQWEIVVDDNMVKNVLEQFYKETGTPIREYIMDRKKFETVRHDLREQIITERLINAFKPVYKFDDKPSSGI